MKRILLILLSISFAMPAAERPPQPSKKNKEGDLGVLPRDVCIMMAKAGGGPTLIDAMANIKRYYLAHPLSQKSVETTKAILAHLIETFHLNAKELQDVVNSLKKSSRMVVFQDPLMLKWIRFCEPNFI